ncbi:LacI family DNA-binding transcriptional regulator [Sinomonas terrae]|uniref:Substrate-binding domain-containing protein n=1 Tax=Sinomonas terrae TaxID=2908838 RepID=A0ABS9U0Q5_9MICC|nr:substrate-binding domain-containing protein [Sinomonas terrae]MCH6470072.1 substrate-binding domain-containing protein [Sinomonas terrae]
MDKQTPARRRPSMADVGRLAHVSAQTVSRLYTGGTVSSDSRRRIEAAVKELGYRPNKLPRSLRGARTETIGFLAMGPLNYGNAGILTGISRTARLEDQTLITTQFDLDVDDPATREEIWRALDSFMAIRVDGIIVATPYAGLETVIEHIDGAVPVVSLSERDRREGHSVHADSYGAARLAVHHLVELGHRRILHLAGPGNRNEASNRVKGYYDGLAAAGLDPLPLLHCQEWDADSGAACAAVADTSTFSAVFAANDEIALGFMSEMSRRGVVAPRDYSIVGVDDMPEARYFSPPLTSAELDFEKMGERALHLLLDQIRGTTTTPRGVVTSSLSVRASTAPHPNGQREDRQQ